MKKDVSICFRTSMVIRDELSRIAEAERKSLSSVIESILFQQLKMAQDVPGFGPERRRFKRKKVFLPAFIGSTEAKAQEYGTGTILDLSLEGIRFSVPREAVPERPGEGPDFSLIFTLPEEQRLVKVKCLSRQVYDHGEDLQYGASIVDSDFGSSQALQRYLN